LPTTWPIVHRGDPELVFVVMMCSYATDIARGVLPGPFDDVDARRYARAALIPQELLERSELDVDHTAAARSLCRLTSCERRATSTPGGSAGDGGAERRAPGRGGAAPGAQRRCLLPCGRVPIVVAEVAARVGGAQALRPRAIQRLTAV
jgi:hypothetical protein